MKAKQVCKLQENLAKEAIAYLMLYGTAVDVTPYRKAVTQVGTRYGDFQYQTHSGGWT